jgi:predicted aldo/keto reductase-like oxidoreductase
MIFSEKTLLGRTGLKVGRLGISSSFGAPVQAYEAALERGCNYVTWGTFIKGRSGAMCTAIRNLVAAGRRDELVVGMLSYAHSAWLTEHFFVKGLKAANLEFADILLLGYFSDRPSGRIIEGALRLKEKGLARFIGLTGHNRRLFPELAEEGVFDVFHVRYNAAHRGAENDIFPCLDKETRPGIVSFTATAWQKLLKLQKMPPGEKPLTAADCYRFALSHPAVDVCMMGAASTQQMTENLKVLEQGPLTQLELERIRRIGDHIGGK